ncbi:uncharacterized protein P174DRAFT_418843 [Aspergillus novofumigatus IBT 16806]|uniref:Uncharacterized protein n=1 Tax=Aspergillus novofumigatus (strain IBT 16806) TaxID=1392255 RepID=A0A2I1CB55_ASPN1|nr:uncharacterized protein P174DRAFT_418843 [Aspergillus novofumigatus IBT 16806]PKX94868.1 hypothetical protein P174DRAFT_418843 [Aspergillus novofumigatus IBT 16806]
MAEECKPAAWRDFVYADPHLRELEDLREKGWQTEAGDTYWEARRKAAATPNQG